MDLMITIHQPHLGGPGFEVNFLLAHTKGWIIHNSDVGQAGTYNEDTYHYVHDKAKHNVLFFDTEREATLHAYDLGLISKARALKVLVR